MKAHIENVEPIWLRPEPTGPCDFSHPVFCGLRVTFVMPQSDAEAANREAADLICARADNWEIDPKRRRVERLAKGTEAARGL